MNATTTTTNERSSSQRSPSDLEREGEQIRANLDRTLDEIQHRFSSGELLDRSMEFLRDNGMELLREAGETVRRNPVPVLLTAAGLVWLTTSVASSRSGSRRSGEGLAHYKARARARATYRSGTTYRSGNGGDWDSSTHGRMRNVAHRMRGKAQHRMEGVKDQVQEMTGRVKGKLSSSMRSAHDRGQQAGSNFTQMVQENPVALGALALAAGALLGAALPMSRYENRWVGPMHDRTMERAKEAGQREYENIRQAVSARDGSQSRSAESRGVESGNGSQAASDGGEGVTSG